MKKTIAILILFAIMISLCACGEAPIVSTEPTGAALDSPAPQEETKATEPTVPSVDNQESEITWENWGVVERCPVRANGLTKGYYINFPLTRGFTAGDGIVSEQLDGTMSIISGQGQMTPEIGALHELFPAYFEHLQFTLKGIYGGHATDYEFFLDGNRATTIHDYDMHIFNGRISLVLDDVPQEYQFVAYATTLQSNGAYAYWVVYDTSEDQSNGELIAEYADNMAHTFREETD